MLRTSRPRGPEIRQPPDAHGSDGRGRPAPDTFPDFAAYVEAQLPALLRLGHALTGNRHDASDLVQEALERVGLRWAAIQRGGGQPHAYARRTIVNAWTSRWRRRRWETLVAEPPETVGQTHDRLENDELWAALRALPPRQRAVIVLRYYEDLSEKEIAVTLGVTPGTVKSQASRALATLRQGLDVDPAGRKGADG